MDATMNQGVPADKMHRGAICSGSDFKNQRAGDAGNLKSAAKVNVIERVVLLLLHILINFERGGHTPVEMIWLLSNFWKDGGLTESYIGLLRKLGLSVSNPTITTNLRPRALRQDYEIQQEKLRKLGRETVESSKGFFNHKYIMLGCWDNYAFT